MHAKQVNSLYLTTFNQTILWLKGDSVETRPKYWQYCFNQTILWLKLTCVNMLQHMLSLITYCLKIMILINNIYCGYKIQRVLIKLYNDDLTWLDLTWLDLTWLDLTCLRLKPWQKEHVLFVMFIEERYDNFKL